MKTFEKKIVLKVLVQKPSGKKSFWSFEIQNPSEKKSFRLFDLQNPSKKNRFEGYDLRPGLFCGPFPPTTPLGLTEVEFQPNSFRVSQQLCLCIIVSIPSEGKLPFEM